MASFKQPCIHCGEFIDRDTRVCPKCYSRSPFGYRCPSCLRDVQKGQAVCSGCGRPLIVACPTCRLQTFAGERCDACGAGLMINCTNPRCGDLQFFDLIKCTACGKKINRNMGGR